MKKQLLAALLAATATAAIAEETVASSNAIGIMEVSSDKARTIVAVPWTAIGSGNVAIGDLVLTDNLTTGDILYAYENGTYKAWSLNSSGAWVPAETVTLSGATTAAQAASAYTLARGTAFWLERKSTSSSFYLLGQAADGAATTSVAAGTSSAPVWTLVANPTLAAKALTVAGTSTTDELVFIDATGKPTTYTYKDGQGWGTQKVQTVNGRPTKQWTLETGNIIPVGQGFWYVNKGAASTISWN